MQLRRRRNFVVTGQTIGRARNRFTVGLGNCGGSREDNGNQRKDEKLHSQNLLATNEYAFKFSQGGAARNARIARHADFLLSQGHAA